MEKHEYETMYRHEDSYWWYEGLRDAVFSSLRKSASPSSPERLLDAGCGTGGVLARIQGFEACGFDLSQEALRFCAIRGLRTLCRASVTHIPMREAAFRAVVSLDVLDILGWPEVSRALMEFRRVLEDDGVLILNLPAFNWLKSRHDEAVHINHRYVRSELRRLLNAHGFAVELLTYRISFLFPVVALIRILKKAVPKRRQESTKSDLNPLPRPLNRFLTGIVKFENRLIMSSFRFPFGLSLFCVARKIP